MNDVKAEAKKLEGWTLEEETLSKTFQFNAYLDGINFVQKLAMYAEGAQHHPHVTIDHTNVTIKWTTVDQGALTEKDIAGANACAHLIK